MVYGMNTSYYNPYQNNMLQNTSFTPIQYGNNTPILNGGVTKTSNSPAFTAKRDNTADGKDDGSIGFWGATKNFGKGVWNFLTSPFKNEKGEWSLKSTLKSVAIGAAIGALYLIPGVGPVLTPALIAASTTAGVIGAGKAVYNIATATTDAEAEAAWQSMGSSTATIAASVVGAKNYAKGAAAANGVDASRYNGIKGSFRAVGRTFTDTGRNVRAGFNFTTAKLGSAYNAYKDGTLKAKVTDKYHTVKDAAVDKYHTFKDNAVDAYKEVKTTANEYGQALKDKRIEWKAMTSQEKKEAIKSLRKSIQNVARDAYKNRGETWASIKSTASDPKNIGIYSWLTTQTVKPNFYDSLSKEEQAYFDALPKEQRDQLEESYYSMV